MANKQIKALFPAILLSMALSIGAQPEISIEGLPEGLLPFPEAEIDPGPAIPDIPSVEVPDIDFTEPEIPKEIDEALPDDLPDMPLIDLPDFELREELSPFQRFLLRQIPLTVSRRVNHFGYNFFRTPPSTFAPVDTIPVTAGYVIGPGDEIRINVWGMIDARWNLVVDRDGTVNIPTAGTVSVAGLTYEQLEKQIEKELSKYYKEFNLNVTMGRLRTINVYLVGNVRRPGNYTVSSLATLVNALFVSGGPTTSGTMRDIHLRRGGETIVRFDMYDFLLKGDKTRDIRLQPEDVIFIPPTGPAAAILGNVTNPAIYELRGDTTITQLIAKAGGLTATSYLKRVQVERIYHNEAKIILDKNLLELREEDDFKLLDGDIVAVYPISDTVINAITLGGNISRPGQYQWKEGLRISDLISQADLLPETNLQYAIIERLRSSDLHRELVFFNLGKAIFEQEPSEDLLLQPYDRITIYSLWEFAERYRIRMESGVNRPGRYIYREAMRISDAVKLAGGLRRAEHPESYQPYGMIIRRMPPDYREEKILFNLHEAVFLEEKDSNILLYPHDTVKILDAWEMAERRVVRITGAAHKTGEYKWAENMRVKDLINIAGGLRYFAYTQEAEITRVTPTPTGPKTERIYINLEKALKEDPGHNILLNYNDYLFIRPVPDWQLYQTVKIDGEVKFPGTYTIKKGETITSLIARAGGFTEESYIRGAVFTREDVRRSQREQMDRMIDQLEMAMLAPSPLPAEASATDIRMQERNIARKQELINKLKTTKPDGRIVISLADAPGKKIYDIELQDGDNLTIPKNPGIITVLGAVYNPTSFIYDGSLDYNRYIQLAGGFTPTANRREVYIIKADGTVTRPSRNMVLEPGDAVIAPERIEVLSLRREIREIIDILYRAAMVIVITERVL